MFDIVENRIIIKKISMFGIIFLSGIFLGWIVRGNHWDTFFISLIPALATLFAAYSGAKYAFQFQWKKEQEENKKRNVVSGNIAIFNFMRMHNKLLNFQIQIIDPVRDRPMCYVGMRATSSQKIPEITINFESLYFLLETEDIDLLGELENEYTKFQSALTVIDMRSQLHGTEVQPLLEKAGFVPGNMCSNEDLITILGIRLYLILIQQTKDVIEYVDKSTISLKKISDKLASTLKRLYPNETIMKLPAASSGVSC